MRIVIDMQGAQSSGSRNRGIGRYSLALAEAMVRNRQEHEIVLALSGLFPETIEPIREAFSGLLPPENIRVWHAPTPVNFSEPSNLARRRDAQSIYEAFLHELGPDIVHITNIFEGLVDDAVTCVPTGSDRYLVGITLYDLIPHLYPDPYLLNPVVNEWYREKIAHLRRADLWLAISDSSKEKGIRHLNLPRDRCHNISTDVDPKFCQASLSSAHEESIRQKYGLTRNFVMYTGGIDHRKNIEGLIRAFGNLPPPTRQNHQLAVVCAVNAQDQKRLQQLAAAAGLASDQLVMTGFIPDNDLFSLYNLCALFVFPSWHEGFGLPALEAMRCGAPTIGSNASSLPEVIGWSEALFDPRSDQDMTRVMLKGLTDEKFRSELKDRQAKHATLFSWDESARRAIAAMSAIWTNKVHHHTIAISELQVKRMRMAYVSPLPSARSGVADYSAELLPALAKYYDIEVVACQDEPIEAPWINENLKVRTVKWFVEHAADYDRILYHCGNSSYHQHIFDLIDRFPGTVVLHDFFLSSIQAHREISGASAGAWIESLYNSHGYHAVHARLSANDVADTVWHYPVNLSILQRATGVIVHSAHSANLARYWYGPNAADDWSIIPLLRVPAKSIERSEARLRLGIPLDELLICCC